MPAVNAELLFQAMAYAKADFNQLTKSKPPPPVVFACSIK